ncbi:putative sensor histidine kinase protein [Alteromonas macleodii str. 'Black Sea 11']|uniref:ATP-binding protein n=1 Tax=Alteromonas abrolhosensis TaxID=1892904 RepID=UPI000286E606|nr:putative sensor histidine kinase protein [Alteromonas macleodii str. 'Black Sea 11']NKW90275.1 HAMP domain-containing protein [Alteromonadaceae bacterium A_SAG4]NKX04599.1 HAMP domain-containing protein [Alteromonadaceae bacterium A_SAG6]
MVKLLRSISPTRAIMGRLFLWFWATFIVTSLLAIWGSRLFFEDLQVVQIKPREVEDLNQAIERMQRERFQNVPLHEALDRNSRGIRGRLVAVDIRDNRLVSGGGPPLRDNDKEDLLRLVNQTSPIAVKRGAFKILGPVFFERDNSRFALFAVKLDMPEKQTPPVLLFLAIALITTTLLSWLFAKTLTNPILHIQGSAKRLASGDWQTRVGKAAKRQDELGQLARDFNKMAEQLESMWGAQKRLLADVSHELRSPLARLQMALGLAHQQNVDPATLSRVEREADRMEALVSQLLTLSRAEAGEATMQKHALSLVLNDVLTDANFEAANKNKQLRIDDIPKKTVVIDSMMFCRAVENVLRNAIRHSKLVTHIAFSEDAQHWYIHITDDGDGLTSEECERIFSPFYRATLARERESGGVGLGLSIAKAAVELHHGRIIAEPSERGGLRVTMSFPKL